MFELSKCCVRPVEVHLNPLEIVVFTKENFVK